MALILSIFAIGTSLGPFIGGAIVQTTTWRWLFYINLPIGGTAIILLYFVLHTGHDKTLDVAQRIRKLDAAGALILTMTTVAILFALTKGGTTYKWTSGHIMVSLILGLCGFPVYLLFEGSKYCVQPMTPLRLFQTRTAVLVAINTFINSYLLICVIFYLPLYFQAILSSSPLMSGVQLLPSVLLSILGAAFSAVVLARYGKYRSLHLIGFGFVTLGLGLFSLLGRASSVVEWVMFQIIAAIGSGMIYDSLLPAFQATISEKDQAAGTALLTFIRCFSDVWGFAIPTVIFNARIDNGLHDIADLNVRNSLANGRAYQHATVEFVSSLDLETKNQVIALFSDALRMVWWVSAGIASLSLLLTFLEKDIPLRTELETEYGLKPTQGAELPTTTEGSTARLAKPVTQDS
jgi:MFS family permease